MSEDAQYPDLCLRRAVQPTSPSNSPSSSAAAAFLQNLIDQIAAGKLNADIFPVIASRRGVAGIERAENAGLICDIIERKNFASPEVFSQWVFERCRRGGLDLPRRLAFIFAHIPPKWEGKVMNIRPSLLPRLRREGHVRPTRPPSRPCQQPSARAAAPSTSSTITTIPARLSSSTCCPVLATDTPGNMAHRVF